MHRLLLLASATIILCLPALAQDMEWQFQSVFPPDTLQTNANGFHGVAVDPDGRVWLQTHNSRLAEVDGAAAEALHIYNADGTEVDFSPLAIIVYEDGVTPADTIGTLLGRGLRADLQGNILASYGNMVFKINYQTGQGMARVDFGTPTVAATADAAGNIYVGAVLPGNPIRMYNSNLEFIENVRDDSPEFSRSHQVSPDGQRFYETNFTQNFVIIHERPDEFSPFDSVGVALRGLAVESSEFHPVTGNLWVSSGNNAEGNEPNTDPEADRFWHSNTWYEFQPDNLTTPLDSIVWEGCVAFDEAGLCLRPGDPQATDAAARPRGFAFSPDGLRAYPVSFNAAPAEPGSNAQFHAFLSVSTEPGIESGLFTLSQNYPNPFASSTTIEFEIEQPGHVTLRVFDLLGRQVAVLVDAALPADSHVTTLEAGSLATGTYLYTLEVDGQRLTSRRMLVVR